MRFSSRPASLRSIAVFGGLLALVPDLVEAQSLFDPVVPVGELRLSGGAQFLSWRDRFGLDGEREPLAVDLTRASGAELFPGVSGLESALGAALDGSFPLRLGASSALVSHNEVRVPLSLDVGVLDRLTLGVTVPLVRTTLEADLRLAADEAADLGVNPTVGSPGAVNAFYQALRTRAGEAQALAGQLCGQDPGSAECTSATSLAADLAGLVPVVGSAYSASALFPAAGTAAGDALVARFAAVDAALTGQGLAALGSSPPLAAAVLDVATLQDLLSDPGGPFAAAPLSSYGGLWGVGDVEVRAAARLLGGERVDSAGVPTLAWSLSAVATVRLPTGAQDSTGVFLDRGRDDGQTDLEGSAFASVATRRLALRARATYTLQQAGEIDTRIAPFGAVFSGRGDVARLEWDPGDGVRFDVEPAFRIAPALSVAVSWMYLHRGGDTFTRIDPLPQEEPGVDLAVNRRYYADPGVLDVGTEVRLQELGGSLTYRSAGLPETGAGGFEAFLRLRKAISGSGGRVPAGIRGEFGLRMIRRLWGG